MGAKIGKGVRLKVGTYINVPNKNLNIGDNVQIGPLVIIQCDNFKIGERSKIQSLVRISVNQIELGSYTTINSFAMLFGKKVTVGDHSWIMYHCYIDSTKEVRIGNKVGIGGHSFIFTHGNWQDYLNGGPLSFGPVTLEDNAWIPWRAFIMPNVTIGQNAILGANSLANKSIPPNKIAVGAPAKVIGDTPVVTSPVEKVERLKRIITDYIEEYPKAILSIGIDTFENLNQENDLLFLINYTYEDYKENCKNISMISVIDHPNSTIYIADNNRSVLSFVDFLTNYGIRLYKIYL